MSGDFTSIVEQPELIFGLVGAIGVDLDYIYTTILDTLKGFNYDSHLIHLTKVMTDVKTTVLIDESDLFRSYSSKIDYANELRKSYKHPDILAALAISAISRSRKQILAGTKDRSRGLAFVIRQLKTPEEIRLLRAVYGRQFILVSIYGTPQRREDYLVAKIKMTSKGTINQADARNGARSLIERDLKEDSKFGQNISSAFPLGDVFVDSGDRTSIETSLSRFLSALFGSNEISPTRVEYGMYLAKSASLRSSDLSRQVGAAIFSDSGEVVSLGSNEVPRAGGGTYWTGDPQDSRDMQQGHDPNELNKVEVFADLISRLAQDQLLSKELLSLKEPREMVVSLLKPERSGKYKDSRIMDLIEFGRIIHAEMSAICDAARNGNTVRNGTLYSTTFPCHLCAKHIVASGLRKVVYLEPYPKSYAKQLHSDSIQIDEGIDKNKVSFEPFIGISPFRYRDLFEKGRRKGQAGEAMKWKTEPRRPMLDMMVPSHTQAESLVTGQLTKLLAETEKSKRRRSSPAKNSARLHGQTRRRPPSSKI